MQMQRRQFLAGAGLLLAMPGLALARVATRRRFVFVIQRGAADGLGTLIPYADPAYARLRGALAADADAARRLDGLFALHGALPELGRMWDGRQALFVHAVASAYRDRSHFDAQNVLESGGRQPFQLRDGWLNRLVGLLPRANTEALALAPTVPLALRGTVDVASFAPSGFPHAPEDLLTRVGQMYAEDARLAPLWTAAVQARGMAGARERRQDPQALARAAAAFLVNPDGPRIAMIETGGWDTHAGQAGRLAAQLGRLDGLLGSLRDGLGAAWQDTVVLVATEFGRTVAVNGTGGTDHGTGSLAMLVGGAVQGGAVLADWPGLGTGDLLDGRDLRPTMGLDHLIAQVASETFSIDPERARRTLFPGMPAAPGVLPRLLRG